jgi:hypothetical protein
MIMQLDENELGALMNGPLIIIDALIRELENQVKLDRQQFASALDALADDAAASATTDPSTRRLDLLSLRQMANLLRFESSSVQQMPRWTPELIQGGLSEPPDKPSTS